MESSQLINKAPAAIALTIALIALITWILVTGNRDKALPIKPAEPLLMQEQNTKSLASKEENQPQSAEPTNKKLNLVIASEAEIEAMSIDEYLDYMLGPVEMLPADIQAEFHTQQATRNEYWENLGFFSDEQKEGYASYDRDTLEALGDRGDLIALDILAHKYEFEDKNHNKAIETYFKGVLFASAKAAQSLAIRAESTGGTYYEPDTQDYRAYIHESIVWYKVSDMMGNKTAEGAISSMLKAQGITLNKDEWANVNQRAELIYAKLNEQRREIGLPEYDK